MRRDERVECIKFITFESTESLNYLELGKFRSRKNLSGGNKLLNFRKTSLQLKREISTCNLKVNFLQKSI